MRRSLRLSEICDPAPEVAISEALTPRILRVDRDHRMPPGGPCPSEADVDDWLRYSREMSRFERVEAGDQVMFELTPHVDGHLHLVNHGSSGRFDEIFPNRCQGSSLARAGQTVRLGPFQVDPTAPKRCAEGFHVLFSGTMLAEETAEALARGERPDRHQLRSLHFRDTQPLGAYRFDSEGPVVPGSYLHAGFELQFADSACSVR